MSNRLNQEREAELQPKRMATAKMAIQNLGYVIEKETDTMLSFRYKGSEVLFYPSNGWTTGSTVASGYGIEHLLNQIKFR